VQAGGRRGPRLSADARRILTVQALRAFAYGFGSVVLGISLERRGLSTVAVGLVLAALLAGAALASFAVARFGDAVGRGRTYGALLALMGLAGAVFALTDSMPALVVAALTGTISTEIVESGPFTSLEQSMLPSAAGERDPTQLFGTYNVVATLAGSLGALSAAVPALVDGTEQRWLLVYPAAAALALVVARGISPAVAPRLGFGREAARPALDRSRPIVLRLSALFALDSFAGGFVVQAFVAYWFAREFGTSGQTLGVVFFAIGLLQAISFQAAVRLARRIGLLRTMVFTHLPSNLLLASIALAPTEAVAIVLLLARSLLSQMDVPTRQAYVVAVVDPTERTAAAAYTNGARYLTRPIAPLLLGPLLAAGAGVPFVVAGALKSVYDLGLYALFRHVGVREHQPDRESIVPSPAGPD
jgi:MFS family permease